MSVIKANKLIEASYKLSSREQCFIIYLVSLISSEDTNFREYTMSIHQIKAVLNFDGQKRVANHEDVFSMIKKLNSVAIRYEDSIKAVEVPWIIKTELDKTTDTFTFQFSPELKDFLLQLKEHFTRYHIENIMHLNGHAIRLYEVLKRYQFQKQCTLTVRQLKFFLGIEDLYPEYYEFKRRVLVFGQQELKKYTDICFDFEPAEKEGKQVISLLFTIYENTPDIKTQPQLPTLGEVTTVAPRSGVASTLEEITKKYTKPQYEAIMQLQGLGVSLSFIQNTIIPNIKNSELMGYEDWYVTEMLQYFLKHSHVKNEKGRAAVFVNWYKQGIFTTDTIAASLLEKTLARKKTISDQWRNLRQSATNMSAAAFDALQILQFEDDDKNKTRSKAQKKPTANDKDRSGMESGKKTKPAQSSQKGLFNKDTDRGFFSIEQFQLQYPMDYIEIVQQQEQLYQTYFNISKKELYEQYERHITNSIHQHCLKWWQEKQQ